MSKGVPALQEQWGDDAGYRNATLFFFLGLFVTYVLDLVVHFIASRVEPADKPTIIDATPRHGGAEPDVEAAKDSCPDLAALSTPPSEDASSYPVRGQGLERASGLKDRWVGALRLAALRKS